MSPYNHTNNPLFLVSLLWLLSSAVSCGGQAVQAGSTDAGSKLDAHDAKDSAHEPTNDGGKDAAVDAPEEDAGLRCLCRNWTDDAYASAFFDSAGTDCVIRGCAEGEVCCATLCVDPSVCHYTGFPTAVPGCDWSKHHPGDIMQPPDDCCWHYGFTACVAPHLCADGGVLQHRDADYEKDTIDLCIP